MTQLDRLRKISMGEPMHKISWFYRKTKIPLKRLEQLLVPANGFGRHGPGGEWIEFNPILAERHAEAQTKAQEAA